MLALSCPNKQRSFERFMCFDLAKYIVSIFVKYMYTHEKNHERYAVCDTDVYLRAIRIMLFHWNVIGLSVIVPHEASGISLEISVSSPLSF